MFSKHLEQLRSNGREYVTLEEICLGLNISKRPVKLGLFRLKQDKKLLVWLVGLHVIVPPEHRAYGCTYSDYDGLLRGRLLCCTF